MASPIRFACYNLHGFNNGSSGLSDLCQFADIIAIEEHWLTPYNLDQLLKLDDDFMCFGWSAMYDRISAGFITGRPHGGLGLLIRKSLNVSVSVIEVMSNCRVAAVKISFNNHQSILAFVVYFPCYNKSDEYVDELGECLGFIEKCARISDCDNFIILGDMNFECVNGNVGYNLFLSLCEELHLKRADDMCGSDIDYTYMQESTGVSSVIDHIFMSVNLVDKVSEYAVCEDIANLSDHLPVKCVFHNSSKCNFSTKPQADVYHRRWDRADLDAYYITSGRLLQQIHIPTCLLNCTCDTLACCHWSDINEYYRAIVVCIQSSMNDCVPMVRNGGLKPFWNSELQDLKQASIDAHRLWKLCDKPRHGIVNKLRLESKYRYKLKIKELEYLSDHDFDDELSNLYVRKDTNAFWRKWNSRFSKRAAVPVNIDGVSNDVDIANAFCESFSSAQFNSYSNSADYIDCIMNVQLTGMERMTISDSVFDVSDIETAMRVLKFGKSGGVDGLTKESLFYCHPSVIVHLKFLFGMMMLHGFVPDDFGIGVIVPVIKDKFGDVCASSNYRPITVSPVISKLFEYCILHKYNDLLSSDSLQFGFKKQHSCSHVFFVLNQVVNYFSVHGSSVYLASLDASKAFDRVNHVKLFKMMILKGLPANVVRIMIDWYGKTFSVVKWNNIFSREVCVRSGIRQGGILSPVFFNIYMDSIISSLRTSSLGCYFKGVYVGCIVYADDILLISASVVQLQQMLDLCSSCADDLDIHFNHKKSNLIKFGHDYNKDNIDTLKLNGCDVTWVNRLKYLGIHIVSDKLINIDVSDTIRKFYAAANAIAYRTRRVNEMARLSLFESFTLPILCYGCEGLHFTNKVLKKFNVCWNNVYRIVFGMHKWESVKGIQWFCESLDCIRFIHNLKLKFYSRLCCSPNNVVSRCFNWFLHSNEFKVLCRNYDVTVEPSRLKFNVFSQFYLLCLSSL